MITLYFYAKLTSLGELHDPQQQPDNPIGATLRASWRQSEVAGGFLLVCTTSTVNYVVYARVTGQSHIA